jgi:hypothetical protein
VLPHPCCLISRSVSDTSYGTRHVNLHALQEWAAAILGRRRYASAGDPLMHLFDE